MDSHVRILGILRIVMGCLGLTAGLALFLFFGGIASLVGATAATHDPQAALAVPLLTFLGGIVFFVLLILSLPSIVAGAGLLKFRPWARLLTIVLSAIDLLNVPLGTALGIYGLWVLLSRNTEMLFAHSPQRMF